MNTKSGFTFEISLSVLNHLGRNLYRNFMTVIGEAISNSWDADARNVWIDIEKNNNSLLIKDDGYGMTGSDFQDKFLKIGYSKRKDGSTHTPKGRPYIGRKGIGKLALLSCAKKITIITKSEGSDYIYGTINNSELDQAIKNDLTPDKYQLSEINPKLLEMFKRSLEKGTIIYFEEINDGIKENMEYLKKTIALYFRFSLLDPTFSIFVEGENITIDQLEDLSKKTEFLWILNEPKDPYIDKLMVTGSIKETKSLSPAYSIKGFITSVNIPKDLKIVSANEKIGVDLFVNGRIREKDILRHIPTARIVESYLYGQVHFDALDGDKDRFTTSREGIVADDEKFKEFLEEIRKLLSIIIEDWDRWRIKHRKPGDSENQRLTEKERKSRELFNVVSEDFSLPEGSDEKEKVDSWVDSLADDAQFNFSSYADCFLSENLIRKYIEDKKIALSPEAIREIDKWKNAEEDNKGKGNVSIDIRQKKNDLCYLAMDDLANLVDKRDPAKEACLSRDAKEYKPIRDAVAHTALVTDLAKTKLNMVFENIKARIKALFS